MVHDVIDNGDRIGSWDAFLATHFGATSDDLEHRRYLVFNDKVSIYEHISR
jgi:hypothetical protein